MLEYYFLNLSFVQLVITIIVLLILAAVTLNFVLGENGIITKARNAKIETEKAQYGEELQIFFVDAKTEYISINNTVPTLKELCEYVRDTKNTKIDMTIVYKQTASITITDGGIQTPDYVEITYKNYTFTMDANLNITAQREQAGGTPTVTEYTVTFNTNGGSSIASEQVVQGETATRPATDPSKDDYTFEGWYADAELTTEYDFTTITGNTTIYAKWEEVATGPRIIEKGQTTARLITTADYGRKVSYLNNAGTGQMAGKTWRLFYVEDSDNTFGDGEGTIYIKADYSDLTHFSTESSYNSSKTLIRKLNPKWANGPTSSSDATKRGEIEESSWNSNEKAAARLCDTSVWEPTYKSTNTAYIGKINWVVGAPSAEMFMKSYGQSIGNLNYVADYTYSDYPGYIYSTPTETNVMRTEDDSIVSSTGVQVNGRGLYLYRKVTSNPVQSTWLSSPSAVSDLSLCYVTAMNACVSNSRIGKNDSGYWIAASSTPLVSLQPSVVLQEID